MKLKYTFLLLGIAVVSASCSHLYTPALYHQDVAYQPKPASFDSVKSATYISAGVYGNANTNISDMLLSGQLNISRGHVFDGFNVAYGGFASFGDYQNSTEDKNSPTYFSDKFFGAVGGRFSANAFVKTGRADFRFIGMEAIYSHEFGDYADFRKLAASQNPGTIDARTDLFTLGLTSEVIFHNRDNTVTHGIRGFFGATFGPTILNDNNDDTDADSRFFRRFFPKASYFVSFKNYFGTAEIGSNIFIRFGYKF